MILKKLSHLLEGQNKHADFTLQQFQEQMDKTVTEAKGELESFLQNKMIHLASQSLLQDKNQPTPPTGQGPPATAVTRTRDGLAMPPTPTLQIGTGQAQI